MGLFDKILKKGQEPEKNPAMPAKEAETKEIKQEAAKKETVTEKPKEKIVRKAKKRNDAGQSYKTLVRPLVTEKAADLGMYGKYVFQTDIKANKIEIKKAIESIYGVSPVKVNIVNVSGKKVNYGKTRGRTKDWKKAIVTLKPGDKIEIYKGV